MGKNVSKPHFFFVFCTMIAYGCGVVRLRRVDPLWLHPNQHQGANQKNGTGLPGAASISQSGICGETEKTNHQEGLVETIDPNKPMVTVTGHHKAENRSRVIKGEFDAIFRQAVDSTEFKRPRTESAPFISDIRPAQFSSESLSSESTLIDRAQRLIDTMDVYRQKLIESGTSLKEIQPLVEIMATESEALSAASDAVEGRQRLKSMVDQSLALASMEIAKFNSGHYNPS
jgi:hypothetical protein